MSAFKWRHFAGEVILWAVRWSCRSGIGSVALPGNATICSSCISNLDHTCCGSSKLMQQIRKKALRFSAPSGRLRTARSSISGGDAAMGARSTRSGLSSFRRLLDHDPPMGTPLGVRPPACPKISDRTRTGYPPGRRYRGRVLRPARARPGPRHYHRTGRLDAGSQRLTFNSSRSDAANASAGPPRAAFAPGAATTIE